MKLADLIGSSLMLGLRGCTINQDETRADVDTLKAIGCRGVILFDQDIAGNHPRNVLNPDQLKKFIEDLRNELRDDLIVAIDQEGGQVSRLNQERGFLPSVSAAELATWEQIDIDQYAQQHARQLSSLGIDLNLAPCVDLEIEPASPIIATRERSFGTDAERVTDLASQLIQMHLDEGVRSCIKHFPGHGSSLLDSHMDMCDITDTHHDDEMKVFRNLIERFGSSMAIMPGHLMHRRVDSRLPASLSPAQLTTGLREGLGFEGVIISDSLDMRAIRDHFGEGDSAVLALLAGCDIVLDGINTPGYREPEAPIRLVNAISKAIGNGTLPDGERRLSESKARLDRFFSSAGS